MSYKTFFAGFFIVADKQRKDEFEDKLHVSIFSPILDRVRFLDYQRVVSMYENLKQQNVLMWKLQIMPTSATCRHYL